MRNPNRKRVHGGDVFLNTFRRVACSVLIPLLFMSICVFVFQTTQSISRLGDANLNVLTKEDRIVTTLLESLDSSMVNLVRDPTVIDFAIHPYLQDTQRNASICKVLENMADNNSFILESTLISHFEQLQLTSFRTVRYGISKEWNDCIEKGQTLESGMGFWITNRGTAQELYLYRSVPYGSIGTLATVYLRIDVQAFLNEITANNVQTNSSERTFVYQSDGVLLYSSGEDSSEVTGALFNSLGNRTYQSSLKLLNKSLSVCSAFVNPELGWTYFIVAPALSANNNLFALALPILISVLAACGMGLLLAYRGSKELYRPLEQLVASIPEPSSKEEGARNEYQRLMEYYDALLNRKEEVYEQVQAIKPFLREKFLVSLTEEKPITLDEIQYQIKILDLPFHITRFSAVMLQIDHYYELSYSADEKKDIKEQIRALIATHDHNPINCFSAEVSDETILVLCNDQNDQNDQIDGADAITPWPIHVLAEHLKYEIEKNWPISVTIGLGRVYHEIRDLQTTCLEAKRAMTYKLYRGVGCVIDFNDIEGDNAHVYPVDFEIMQKLLNTVRVGDEQNTRKLLHQMFRSFADAKKFSPEKLRRVLRNLTAALSEVVQSAQVSLQNVRLEDLEVTLSHKRTLSDIEAWLTDLYSRTAAAIKLAHSSNILNNAEKIKRYIDQNLTKDISLSSISEYVGYSPTYVSKIFRQQYGISYIDYLNSNRVSLAKELLVTTEFSIKEIGFQVGFNNLQSYFRIFKKYTSTTPLQFREVSTPAQ
ncbi:MAG: helix-turn-helix domain-containing protein [Oscillospiraceae bacterium]